jgi:ADP-ribose pyrophosphatase
MFSITDSKEPWLPVLEKGDGLIGGVKSIFKEIKNLPSLKVLKKIEELSNIQGIALVGSSASGKSTLMSKVRRSFSESEDVEIPFRYITRPKRLGDNLEENKFVSRAEFQDNVQNGNILIHWTRKMEGNRTEHYGFEATNPMKLAVYSANNDFFRSISETINSSSNCENNKKQLDDVNYQRIRQVLAARKTLLIVGVYAPDEIRKKRLLQRSPDLSENEKKYRIGDSSDNIIPHCHIIINNYGKNEKNAINNIIDLIKVVVANRVKWGEIRDLGNHRIQYSSRLFNIINHEVLFSDGIIKTFEYTERSPGVRTLINDGSHILVTKEWREEIGGWDIRIPGGKLFENIQEYNNYLLKQPDKESLIQKAKITAQKETLEEVGLNLNTQEFDFLHISKCGSVIHWDLYYFSISVERQTSRPRSIVSLENEMIINEWLSFKEVKALCHSGQISEDRTSNVLLKFIHQHQK